MVPHQDASPGDAVPIAGAALEDPEGYSIGGAADWPPLALNGEMDEASVWGEARTRVQIAQVTALFVAWLLMHCSPYFVAFGRDNTNRLA